MDSYSNTSVSNDDSVGVTDTNEQLIAKAVSALKRDDMTDTSLMEVLTEHILKLNPKDTAVDDAVKEIEALAAKRAEEPKNDPSAHN